MKVVSKLLKSLLWLVLAVSLAANVVLVCDRRCRKDVVKTVAETQVDEPGTINYVVQPGDDITGISIRFGVNPSVLCKLNDLAYDVTLVPGQIVKIPLEEKEDKRQSTSPKATTNEPKIDPTFEVTEVDELYDGSLRVSLTMQTTRNDLLEYVSVEPHNGETISVVADSDWDWRTRSAVGVLRVSGDFPFETNLTLRVRAGLPSLDGTKTLESDYVHVFKRKNLLPKVDFASPGRYLPPEGDCEIAFESVNMTNVSAKIYRVEPQNIVHMLAREEQAYSAYDSYWKEGTADEITTAELAGEPMEVDVPVENAPLNGKAKGRVAVQMTDGGPRNGVYLVHLGGALMTGVDRVVAISDLGLSVRRFRDGSCGVWVTSLTTGRPVPGALVEVRSSSNVKIAEGVTDGQGWCLTDRLADGEPFAVIVTSENLDDSTFIALSERMKVDETRESGAREAFLEEDEFAAFAWTERGIYRHDEPIFFAAIVRDATMDAPAGLPIKLSLVDPSDKTRESVNVLTDAHGLVTWEKFAVGADYPSGNWRIEVSLPAKKGEREKDCVLATRTVKIEEFVPPQVRVAITTDETTPTNCTFTVSAEHLFGGAASGLVAKGVVVFDDFEFTPNGWRGYTFGNADLGLKENFTRLGSQTLDHDGRTTFIAELPSDAGLPKAAIRATVQGSVIENGGRATTQQQRVYLHYYDYYIGATLDHTLPLGSGEPAVNVACVSSNGTRRNEASRLKAKLERIDTVYSYRKTDRGWNSWHAEHVRTTIVENQEIEVPADGDLICSLPIYASGDYALTLESVDGKATYARTFYVSSYDDTQVRAPLAKPSAVTLTPDKASYRVGETPQLVVKAPFTGMALLSVMREKECYTEVLELKEPTSTVSLRPVTAEDAPNLNVTLSLVQAVTKGEGHFAVRAHGETTISVKPTEWEIPVGIKAEVSTGTPKGAHVELTVATELPPEENGAIAIVTVVDEGINSLTAEPKTDPLGYFLKPRDSAAPLYDLFERLFPILEEVTGTGDVLTGGGGSLGLLGRVSPIKSRRFKPLALWQKELPIVNGMAKASFDLGEFAGEIRVTAVVVGSRAVGSASIQRKVTPKLVMQPDMPRFAAPGDKFSAILPIYNRGTGESPEVISYSIGEVNDSVTLATGESTVITVPMTAPEKPGELAVDFSVNGIGESHHETLYLPIRPAVAWETTAGIRRLAAEDEVPGEQGVWRELSADEKIIERVFDTPLGEYESALKWLADYPHGCLEQTTSQIFPLVVAGGSLNAVTPNGANYLKAGANRVLSMFRGYEFVMWPDCSYEPWSKEVSVYAAHFLAEANRAGIIKLSDERKSRLGELMSRMSHASELDVCAYASFVKTILGKTDRSRLFRLYDERMKLSSLAKSRLALAFAEIGDRKRAKTLLEGAFDPQSVKDAAFRLLALIALDPDDERVLPLVSWLTERMDKSSHAWGTTEDNAHALIAVGSYYAARPAAPGEKFVSWRKMTLPKLESVAASANGIELSRRYLTLENEEIDPSELKRGEMIKIELKLTCAEARDFNDLVIEELLPAAFEPAGKIQGGDWIMRTEERDDRLLIFSDKFSMGDSREVRAVCKVRVVSAGDFVLPGTRVEGMYDPLLHACLAPARIVVRP